VLLRCRHTFGSSSRLCQPLLLLIHTNSCGNIFVLPSLRMFQTMMAGRLQTVLLPSSYNNDSNSGLFVVPRRRIKIALLLTTFLLLLHTTPTAAQSETETTNTATTTTTTTTTEGAATAQTAATPTTTYDCDAGCSLDSSGGPPVEGDDGQIYFNACLAYCQVRIYVTSRMFYACTLGGTMTNYKNKCGYISLNRFSVLFLPNVFFFFLSKC